MKRFCTLPEFFFAVLCVSGLAGQANADTSLSVVFGVGNAACGTGEWDAGVRVDHDSDDMPYHANVTVGPNGGCSGQSVNVDVAVAKRHYVNGPWFGVVAGGFDRRTVAVEYVRVEGDRFKHFTGQPTDTPTVQGGVGYDCGDNCSVRLLWNFVETARLDGDNIGPLSIAATYEIANVELNASLNDTLWELGAAWEPEDSSMTLSTGVTGGVTDLDNGAPAMIDDYVQAGSKDRLYFMRFGWRI